MFLRLKLLLAAAALLYLGPLLSGLAGYGWANIPAFAAIFMLWLVLMRPQDFPQSAACWLNPSAWLGFAARLVLQVLLVAVCFGIGRGIGGVLGVQPAIPAVVPVAMSLLAVVFGRLISDPRKMQQMDEVVNSALTQIEGATSDLRKADDYAELLVPLFEQPDDATDGALADCLAQLHEQMDDGAVFEALLASVSAGYATGPTQRALMLIASDGAALERAVTPDMPLRALTALRHDAVLVAALARRLRDALLQDDDLWHDLPTAEFLIDLAAELPDAAPDLKTLAQAVAQADPENRR